MLLFILIAAVVSVCAYFLHKDKLWSGAILEGVGTACIFEGASCVPALILGAQGVAYSAGYYVLVENIATYVVILGGVAALFVIGGIALCYYGSKQYKKLAAEKKDEE